jgi:hypothetical protein
MSTVTLDPRASSVALPRLPAALPARPPINLRQIGKWWVHVTYWPAELVRLVALIYMLPIVIYAIGIPIAAAIKTVLFLASWSWKAL